MIERAEITQFTLVTNVFLVLAIVMILARSRTTEMKLILIGVFLGIAAAAQGHFVAVGAGGPNAAVVGGFAGGTLMKLAIILTLAGVGLLYQARTEAGSRPAAGGGKEPPHVD